MPLRGDVYEQESRLTTFCAANFLKNSSHFTAFTSLFFILWRDVKGGRFWRSTSHKAIITANTRKVNQCLFLVGELIIFTILISFNRFTSQNTLKFTLKLMIIKTCTIEN